MLPEPIRFKLETLARDLHHAVLTRLRGLFAAIEREDVSVLNDAVLGAYADGACLQWTRKARYLFIVDTGFLWTCKNKQEVFETESLDTIDAVLVRVFDNNKYN